MLIFIAVVAPDWLHGDRIGTEVKAELQGACLTWFEQAPSISLLKELSVHLTVIDPVDLRGKMSSNVSILSASAEMAVELLVERFGPPSSNGLMDVLLDILYYPSSDFEYTEDVISMISAIPDLCCAVSTAQSKLLRPSSFVPWIVDTIVRFVKEGQNYSNNSDEHDSPKSVVLAGNVVSRLCRRGHVALVATAALGSALSEPTRIAPTIGRIIRAVMDAHSFERLIEELVARAPLLLRQQRGNDAARCDVAGAIVSLWKEFFPWSFWNEKDEFRLSLSDKLLTQRCLPKTSLESIANYLDSLSHSDACAEDPLVEAAGLVADVWGDQPSVQRTNVAHQACMTYFLTYTLVKIGRKRLEQDRKLLPALLEGISVRLQSPTLVVRVQGMRVGRAMSLAIDPQRELFAEENLDMLPEEEWDRADRDEEDRPKRRRRWRPKPSESYPLTETDSDDERTVDPTHDDDKTDPEKSPTESDEDSEFEPYDLEESDEDDPERANLRLDEVLSMLRNTEQDWKGQIRALRCSEMIIRAAPDELRLYSTPLARSLLHARVLNWADEERRPSDASTETCRMEALISLTVASPQSVGLALIEEFYSPSNDAQGRTRALSILSAAAGELASPGSRLKPSPFALRESAQPDGSIHCPREASALQSGLEGRRTRRLQIHQPRADAVHVNEFPQIAMQWTAALLRDVDVRRHGVDLFGRDSFMLGKVLTTLGTFLECCRHTGEAVPLAAAVLELLKAPPVHAHAEPFVRKSALMTAAHVLLSLPSPAISTALLTKDVSGVEYRGGGVLEVYADKVSKGLGWLDAWLVETQAKDADESCRDLASACKGLQQALTSEVLAHVAGSLNLDSDVRSRDFHLPPISQSHSQSLRTEIPFTVHMPSLS